MSVALPSRAALQGLIVYAGFVLICLFFAVMLWDCGLLSEQNLTNIVLQTAPATVLAVGLVFVLASGEIDLSFGATVAQHGADALYNGLLGNVLVDYMKANGGFIAHEDLRTYKTVERQPIRADYRGWQIMGPPPPAASGVHIAEMLNILEGYDIASLGFGTAQTVHYLAEAMKIAFADRETASGDPAYVNGPVERLTSEAYAEVRRRAIDPGRAQAWGAGVAQLEGAHTTHMTAADAFGNVVATTQTINNLFGAKFLIPGLGTIPNNYMNLYDPRPGHALSLAPGKRVTVRLHAKRGAEIG